MRFTVKIFLPSMASATLLLMQIVSFVWFYISINQASTLYPGISAARSLIRPNNTVGPRRPTGCMQAGMKARFNWKHMSIADFISCVLPL